MLAGESAGGGLIYCLCLKLKELGMELPCGLIGISPWTDLTGSGDSYRENRENDPSMTPELLQFYAGCYTQDPTDPLCSPLFGDLTGLPPSLLFVGGDEVMLDDTRALHEKLLAAGCRSRLHIAPERWHAYVLYCLNENMEQDFEAINHFLDRTLSPARSLRWMRLDNAAKIYPAAKRRNWNNFFRLSATLTEAIDVPVLRAALDVTVRRFPSMAVRLRRGVFWYYLEEIPQAPEIQPEKSCPLAHVPFGQVRRCAFRVLVYHNRVAVEFFHAVTDGTGGLIFLKTLVAEYLCQKYGISVPAEKGVLGRLEEPSPQELEDSFLRYAGDVAASRAESTAYHLSGTPEKDGYKNLITMMVPVDRVRACARQYGVTVTELLCAAMMQAIADLQAEKVPRRSRRKPVSENATAEEVAADVAREKEAKKKARQARANAKRPSRREKAAEKQTEQQAKAAAPRSHKGRNDRNDRNDSSRRGRRNDPYARFEKNEPRVDAHTPSRAYALSDEAAARIRRKVEAALAARAAKADGKAAPQQEKKGRGHGSRSAQKPAPQQNKKAQSKTTNHRGRSADGTRARNGYRSRRPNNNRKG